LAILLGLALHTSARAQTTITAPLVSDWPTTLLQGASVPLKDIKAGVLIDPSGKLEVMDLLQSKNFRPEDPYQTYLLGKDGSAWIRLRVQVPLSNNGNANSRGSDLSAWVLEIPAPLLNDVQLYQVGPDQRLQAAQKAGNLLPRAQWSYPSNASAFKLNLYAGETNDLWVRVKYPLATQLPVFLHSEADYLQGSRAYFWGMGLIIGALLFLNFYVLTIVLAFRDWTHLAFSTYLTTTLATLFAYTGLNGYLLWQQSSTWIDVSVGFWQLLNVISSIVFVGLLLQAKTRAPKIAKGMIAVAVFALISLPVYVFADRSTVGGPLLVLNMLLAYAANLSMSIYAWQRGDKVGRTITLFFSALLLNMLVSGMAALGWLPIFWYQQLPVYIFLGLAFPLLLAEMNFKMRHELAMQIRAQGIRSHDALTDTLNEPFLLARMRTIMASPRKRKEAAVVLVDVSNLPYMRENFAQDVVEQTLLRAVIKIKRVFGDMDAIGRIGDNRLALVLENSSKDLISKLAVELIASGLMPSKHTKQDISIIFHFAVVLLNDYEGAADDLMPALQALCDKMSPRTQRPIRYLENKTSPKGRSSTGGGGDGGMSQQDNSQLGHSQIPHGPHEHEASTGGLRRSSPLSPSGMLGLMSSSGLSSGMPSGMSGVISSAGHSSGGHSAGGAASSGFVR